MPAAPTPLDTLMARLAGGDRAVFKQVFEQLWGPIYRLCQGLLKNDADASDAAQEAMQKILERASDYDPARSAMPWAMALAAWECRTLARKRARRREEADAEPSVAQVGGQHAEEDFVRRDLIAAALSALGELSESDQATLRATFLEVAAPVAGATFRKRRERALERLRASFRRIYGLD